MEIKLMTITPETASEYLGKNVKNRVLSKSRVSALSSAMKSGEWESNGDTIRFDKSGNLIDGQHRLSAIVDCGISQEMIVVKGLNEKSFTTIDSGKARTASDVLSVEGVKYYRAAASISRLVLNWNKGGNPHSYTAFDKPTSSQIYDYVKGNDVLSRACELSTNGTLSRIIPPSIMGFIYVSAVQDGISETRVDEFFNRIIQPKSDDLGGVIMMLRDKIMQDKNSKSRMTKQELTAIVIKAMRLWLCGSPVKTLRVRTNGNNKEKNIYKVLTPT